jgi:chromosome segregation protein
MFKLQRLEITGFKSFADYTEIVFTGNGITAVVGPNGCGKSNVSDSIAWVLGEQRAKSLRGGEMKDVVFQGTRDRKPSGMAEVVLHLVRDGDPVDTEDEELEDIDEALSEIDEHTVDLAEIEPEPIEEVTTGMLATVSENGDGSETFEADIVVEEKVQAAQVGAVQTVESRVRTKRHWRPRTFALDFAPGEAVSVTRRLYLSGESEYLLNGRSCRLRDIQDLFAGTGLSGSHYAIIEQGRIGQILSAKPADRRNLIEEAAGISKFRTRQRAAESRLESAKTNLGRVSDIVSEVEKQANSLRRQASKTRRYKILQEEFRVLLRQLFTAEGRHLTALLDELENALTAAIENERRLTARVAEQEDALRAATQNARVAEEKLSETRQIHSQNALERDRAEREHRYQSEQIVSLSSRIEVVRGEILATNDRLAFIREEYEKLSVEEKAERESAGEAELTLREAEAIYREKLDLVNSIEAELESARLEFFQHTSALERFEEVGRQLDQNIEKLAERLLGLNRESVRADESCADHVSEAEQLAKSLASEKQKLDELHKEKSAKSEAASETRAALAAAEDELRMTREENSAKRHRLETLRELEETHAVYKPEVQKLFARENEIGVKLNGVLADKFNVDEKAERAVESLFTGYLQSVLVETREDALKLRTWLSSNPVGRVAVLVMPGSADASKSAESRQDGADIASVLGIDENVAAVLRQIFPRELSARLVDDIETYTPQNGEIAISRNGDMLIGGQLLVSGKSVTNDKNSSLLAFKRELNTLEKVIVKLESDVEAAVAKADEARRALAAKEEEMVDIQSLMIKVERGIHGLEIQGSTARQEIERAERHRKVVQEEIAQIEAELADVRAKREEALKHVESASTSRFSAENAVSKITERFSAARLALDAESENLNDKRMIAATSDERRRSAQSALRRIESEEKELESRLAQMDLEIQEIEGRIAELNTSVGSIAERIAASETEVVSESEELAAMVAMVDAARAEADAMSAALAEANHRSAEAINERADIEVRKAEAITRLQNINEKCAEELGLPLTELILNENIVIDTDLDYIRVEANDLRNKLDGFGAINMLALEELAETEERLTFLTSQRQDIIDSIAAAEEALREIKERSRERFRRAFEAINENFTQFFRELFGGGRGEMSLLEAEDILEAGIEVVAQPPGKRLQNILLLSGGEKAMTAIALVLAIFKYRPSPFCLLDEVDAPLDDANVGRFVNKIADMSEKTQFIVITHNKRTMEAARALYGVTMQEAGVSKVVSVKFD